MMLCTDNNMADGLSPNIIKKVLYAGDGEIPDFPEGAKATFHFKTFKTDENKTQIDCSRKLSNPFELLMGRKFKLEVWEELVKTMRVGEVASFTVNKAFVGGYHVISKSLRDMSKKHKNSQGNHEGHNHEHSCGLSAFRSTGYPDLDELMKTEQDLVFEIELLKVELPGTYKKEAWQMDINEKLLALPKYREEGNALYGEKKYKEAAEKYAEALGCLEQLCLREKPRDEEWNRLDKMKIPFLLNYAQCKLLEKDYYKVIEHTNTVLDKDNDNVKALYRRAKAHVGAWNPEKAREDFKRAAELDPSLQRTVKKELENLDRLVKEHNAEDGRKLKTMFSK